MRTPAQRFGHSLLEKNQQIFCLAFRLTRTSESWLKPDQDNAGPQAFDADANEEQRQHQVETFEEKDGDDEETENGTITGSSFAVPAQTVSLRSLAGETRLSGALKAKRDDGDDDSSSSSKRSSARPVDLNQPELWQYADRHELLGYYRRKSSKARKRFLRHEKQQQQQQQEEDQGHRRDPEDQAYIDSLDVINEQVTDLAEDILADTSAQIQLLTDQHRKEMAQATERIRNLEVPVKQTQVVAKSTFEAVSVGQVVTNDTHEMVVNVTKSLSECLGRPTLSTWLQQGWDALKGNVPEEAGFFQPVNFGQWLQPQSFMIGVMWIVSWIDSRCGSRLSRLLHVHTPGLLRVMHY